MYFLLFYFGGYQNNRALLETRNKNKKSFIFVKFVFTLVYDMHDKILYGKFVV